MAENFRSSWKSSLDFPSRIPVERVALRVVRFHDGGF